MDPIVVTERVDAVQWIRFNRPEARNAITKDSAGLVRSAVEQAEQEKARVIVITGSGGSFCAGADLKSSAFDIRDPSAVASVLVDHYHPMLLAMTRCPLPVIAAVDGIAAGIGSDIALTCDIRLASERAAFSEIFAHVGLIPDGGGTFTLPRLVGLGRALEMAMTGQKVPAQQALEWGMVNHVYATDGFEKAVQSYADQLATKAPLAVGRAKRAMREAVEACSYQEALKKEAALQKDLFGSKDFVEGVTAFLEKRPPQFKGR